ncbi:hypothetical protein SKAU_G00084510 [Synaphobranchus kaupii]|uniref:Uncharacterized protein n=1 Tax=Synaphobranchus kaupii TaxID=118154 RepID=A0A9Q1FVC8_SYNKA|nr:hypothetical protein SKAU_G00084510 [Synaphobranchus kaupii]
MRRREGRRNQRGKRRGRRSNVIRREPRRTPGPGDAKPIRGSGERGRTPCTIPAWREKGFEEIGCGKWRCFYQQGAGNGTLQKELVEGNKVHFEASRRCVLRFTANSERVEIEAIHTAVKRKALSFSENHSRAQLLTANVGFV